MHFFTRRLPILVTLSLVALGLPAPAAADPIQLVSGSISYSRLNLAQFVAGSSDGVSIHSDFGNWDLDVWNPDHACFGCTPGTTIGLSQSEAFGIGDTSMTAGGSVIDGGVDFWIQSLAFQIQAGSFTLPDSTGTSIQLTSPFAIAVAVTGRSDAGVTRTFDFFGNGTARATFFNNEWFSTSYQFAEPTPEPGTLLLLGGPAALALLRRRNKQLADPNA